MDKHKNCQTDERYFIGPPLRGFKEMIDGIQGIATVK